MEKKINLVELLKDCQKGMELDCTIYNDVTFRGVDCSCYPIQVQTPEGNMPLSQYGGMSLSEHAKCVIFPKGKTTWEGFVSPCKFKDGDVVFGRNSACFYIAIYKSNRCEISFNYYACLTSLGRFSINCFGDKLHLRFATEEEKEKLFQEIKTRGYKWNSETKTLEKLPIAKFDITTLSPFDKVLVRDNDEQLWTADLFGSHHGKTIYPFRCVGHYTNQCVPYEGNEHLLGTNNNCDEFYKTW